MLSSIRFAASVEVLVGVRIRAASPLLAAIRQGSGADRQGGPDRDGFDGTRHKSLASLVSLGFDGQGIPQNHASENGRVTGFG